MKFEVKLSENFKKEAKRLVKKYPSLKTELPELFKLLEEDPTHGTHLGKNIYKIRLAIASKNTGKSGGARVLSYVEIIDSEVLLFTIYNKGETDNLTKKEIEELLLKP